MKKYLTEKLEYFLKFLEITREQQGPAQEKNLGRFKLYQAETFKIISKIESLDKRFENTLEAWNSGKTEVQAELKGEINRLNEQIQNTIHQITELHQGQMEGFLGEKKILEKDLEKYWQKRKIFTSYQDPKKSASLLNIKR